MMRKELIAELREQSKHVGDDTRDLLLEAADELEHLGLVAGSISRGPSYADIAKDARHEVPVGETANNG